jgi:hypothetical protein
VWFGVTAEKTPTPSAHLFEYDPQSAQMTDRGNVVDELSRAGLLRVGEHQAKIHSKIVQGPDGCLYFASMDEEGEKDDGSALPKWGGHLWRLRLSTHRWEHLLSTPEALLAVGGGDRFIYALGYFDHVLYGFDTRTGEIRHVGVGAVDGHISRNVLVDYRGHVFVPRLTTASGVDAQGHKTVDVSLVEFDPSLKEVHSSPISSASYLNNQGPTESHGIIGFQEINDGTIFFTTHVGAWYRITPPLRTAARELSHAAATMTPMGWFHPSGSMYVPGLFTPDGTDTLFGLAHTPAGYQWLTCDAGGYACDIAPLEVSSYAPGTLARSSLYGSTTRDARGGYYVVGIGPSASGLAPMILRVQPSKTKG